MNPSAEGASRSINRTIKDIEAIITGQVPKASRSKLRKKLRTKLVATLSRSSRSWYRKGFNRGHKESFKACKARGKVPAKLTIDVEREFVPKHRRSVRLVSRV